MRKFSVNRFFFERFGLRLGEVFTPVVLFVDAYYRTEWFELHTSWGKAVLGPLFTSVGLPVAH